MPFIKKIAHREGKIGDLLADGVKRAAEKIGKGSEHFAIQVKGMEQSAYATHNATSMLLAYMTCDVGAHHNRAWAITYDLQVGREPGGARKSGPRDLAAKLPPHVRRAGRLPPAVGGTEHRP